MCFYYASITHHPASQSFKPLEGREIRVQIEISTKYSTSRDQQIQRTLKRHLRRNHCRITLIKIQEMIKLLRGSKTFLQLMKCLVIKTKEESMINAVNPVLISQIKVQAHLVISSETCLVSGKYLMFIAFFVF